MSRRSSTKTKTSSPVLRTDLKARRTRVILSVLVVMVAVPHPGESLPKKTQTLTLCGAERRIPKAVNRSESVHLFITTRMVGTSQPSR